MIDYVILSSFFPLYNLINHAGYWGIETTVKDVYDSPGVLVGSKTVEDLAIRNGDNDDVVVVDDDDNDVVNDDDDDHDDEDEEEEKVD